MPASFDVYTDADPTDTITIKYASVNDVKTTITKLERLYKSKQYPHKRIFQVASIMRTRIRLSKDKADQYTAADNYFKFLKTRTPLPEAERRKLIFIQYK